MPKYRTDTGVVVDVPEQKAERMDGLTPVDASPASARRARAPKRAAGKEGRKTA
ncbi:hypothetical protein [Mycobacterium sp. HM-7]